MRIVDAKVIVCSPGHNFVTLKVTTDEGVTGVGDAPLNGRELAVASYRKNVWWSTAQLSCRRAVMELPRCLGLCRTSNL